MPVEIDNVTIAANKLDEMVVFYNAVVDAQLSQYEPFPNFMSFRGKLGNLDFAIVSNEVAQVQAAQNRQQFQFIVDDVAETIQTALLNGGALIDEAAERGGRISGAVYDPDGNSMVFVER